MPDTENATEEEASEAGRLAWDKGTKDYVCPYEFGSKNSLAWKRAFFARGALAVREARKRMEAQDGK